MKYTTLVKEFKGPMYIYNEIKNGNISIEKNEEDQKEFKSKLNEITTKKSKSLIKRSIRYNKKYLKSF